MTDASGARARDAEIISFAQTAADEPRTGCPPQIQERNGILNLGRKKLGAVVNNAVVVPTSCGSGVACAGNLVVTRIVAGRARVSAKRRAPLVAFKAYTIPAGGKQTLRAKLNKKSRRLLKRTGRLRVKVSLMSVTLDGKTVTRARTVTLRRRAKRR